MNNVTELKCPKCSSYDIDVIENHYSELDVFQEEVYDCSKYECLECGCHFIAKISGSIQIKNINYEEVEE